MISSFSAKLSRTRFPIFASILENELHSRSTKKKQKKTLSDMHVLCVLAFDAASDESKFPLVFGSTYVCK